MMVVPDTAVTVVPDVIPVPPTCCPTRRLVAEVSAREYEVAESSLKYMNEELSAAVVGWEIKTRVPYTVATNFWTRVPTGMPTPLTDWPGSTPATLPSSTSVDPIWVVPSCAKDRKCSTPDVARNVAVALDIAAVVGLERVRVLPVKVTFPSVAVNVIASALKSAATALVSVSAVPLRFPWKGCGGGVEVRCGGEVWR